MVCATLMPAQNQESAQIAFPIPFSITGFMQGTDYKSKSKLLNPMLNSSTLIALT